MKTINGAELLKEIERLQEAYKPLHHAGLKACLERCKTFVEESEAGHRDGLEAAAKLCDQLGDEEFAARAKAQNVGIATMAQRHYIKAATAIRAAFPSSASSKVECTEKTAHKAKKSNSAIKCIQAKYQGKEIDETYNRFGYCIHCGGSRGEHAAARNVSGAFK